MQKVDEPRHVVQAHGDGLGAASVLVEIHVETTGHTEKALGIWIAEFGSQPVHGGEKFAVAAVLPAALLGDRLHDLSCSASALL